MPKLSINKLSINDELGNAIGFIIGMIALLCLLAYNWQHTSGLLTKHSQYQVFGKVAATGVELAVVWLSFKIGKAKKQNKKLFKTYLPYTLFMVVLVSMAANLSEGFATRYSTEMTLNSIAQQDVMQMIISVLMTSLISVIVFALSDVVGSDAKKMVVSDKVKPNEDKVNTSDNGNNQSINNVQVVEQEVNNGDAFSMYVTKNPYASYREVIKSTGVVNNPGQVKAYAEKLGWHKNGNGWERVA